LKTFRWTIFFLVLVSASLQAQDRPLLDISIKAFDANLPESSLDQQQSGIYPAVRQAEVRYLPSFLKLMLEESGQWGAVRLLPDLDTGAELQLSATIVSSDGSTLELAIRAIDASGRIWTDKIYTGTAVESVSLNEPVLGTDPFLYLYTAITGDLLMVYQSLTSQDLQGIKDIATLRYGAALAPDVFSPYLNQDESGLYQLTRFPADNDPFLMRIREIREHEYVFIDVVDEQYEDFFVSIKPVYDVWRRYRREMLASEADKVRLEQEQGSDFRRGSYMSLRESYNNYRWSRLQDQYLDEINAGFINEVLPTDITLEDSLFHLSGTLDEQYKEWRGILKELYMLDNPQTP
jgi:hypothetical protein